MAVHTKHAFPLKMFNLIQSKNTTFHLFIFLIGLSIGFYCAFYLENFSTILQTSIFSVLHAFSSSQRLATSSLPLLPDSSPSPPPLPSLNPSLRLPTQPISSPLILSPSPQPSLSLSSGKSLFLSPSPQPPLPSSPPPLSSDSINFTTPPSLLISSPSPTQSLSLPSGDTLELSPSPALQPSPTPLPSDSINSTMPPSLLLLSTPSPLTSSSSSRDSIILSPSPSPQLASAPAPIPTLLPESIKSTTQPSRMPDSVSLSEQIPLMHNMSDKDLVKSAMKIATMSVPNTPYKVAFMFLTSGPLPLSPLWELFFKGHESLYSIYIHPHPSYNDTFPKDSIFYGRRIMSQPVYWGDISMVDAERRLLANAVLDASNQRFVLLSESCIPLFNFTTTYNYLVNSNLSYINSFDDPRKSGRGRYNPQMSPNITIQEWRKGSQWFEVNRDLALGIIAEQKYYLVFKEYCHPACYNDEHYLPTMVNILYPKMNSNRSITYVDWSISGPHPKKFSRNHITEDFLNSIRFGSTECVYNNNMTPMCVLFARKFAPNTLMPLLEFASMLFGYNP